MQGQYRHHAVVIGASIGGLAAARVLSDHFDRVTILERDGLAAGAEPRRAVPQGRHAHALLAGGVRALSGCFPGFVEELDRGRGRADRLQRRASGTRPAATARVLARTIGHQRQPAVHRGQPAEANALLPNVTIETGVNVVGLLCDGGRVRGVQLRTGRRASQSLDADFVVDCSGRGSSAHALAARTSDIPPPEVVDVHCNVRYATSTLRRHPDDLDADVRRHPRVATARQACRVRHADRGRPLDHDHRFSASVRTPRATTTGLVPLAATLPIVRAARPVVASRTAQPDVVNHRLPSSTRASASTR